MSSQAGPLIVTLGHHISADPGSAICRLVNPAATSSATSCSRGVSNRRSAGPDRRGLFAPSVPMPNTTHQATPSPRRGCHPRSVPQRTARPDQPDPRRESACAPAPLTNAGNHGIATSRSVAHASLPCMLPFFVLWQHPHPGATPRKAHIGKEVAGAARRAADPHSSPMTDPGEQVQHFCRARSH